MPDAYEAALNKLSASKEYAGVCPATLARVLRESFDRHKKPKDAEKAARERLHGITGAFMSPEESRRAASALEAWTPGDDAVLAEALEQHASTRERLPLAATDALYEQIFAVTGRPQRVLDLACGLNPVYLAARGFAVAGVDIQRPAIECINRMGERHGLPARAYCADLLVPESLPAGLVEERFDLALAFKLLPLLETQRTGAAVETLSAFNADWIAVSFPTRTLGGRNVGMAAHYGEWMEAHVPEDRVIAARFEMDNELVYILRGAAAL